MLRPVNDVVWSVRRSLSIQLHEQIFSESVGASQWSPEGAIANLIVLGPSTEPTCGSMRYFLSP
jgi:hypothetical protein